MFPMKQYFLFLIALFMIVACRQESETEKAIAKIDVDVHIERFDRLFAAADEGTLQDLKIKYPFMFSEKYPDSFWIAKMRDTLQQQLSYATDSVFAEMKTEQQELEDLFRHIKYYFPSFRSPRVITATSYVDYRNKVIVTDSIALISLDTYLGSDHPFYQGIQQYLRQNFTRSQMVVDFAQAYANSRIHQPERKTLLDEMVYWGKVLYLEDKFIPFKSDAEKIGYTQNQLDWSQTNENYIWRYFIERELLYSTDSKLPGRFINPAPFSKFYLEDIDKNSPGEIGRYIGWQIVRAYMENNDVGINDMLSTSPKEIFSKSKFKPRK